MKQTYHLKSIGIGIVTGLFTGTLGMYLLSTIFFVHPLPKKVTEFKIISSNSIQETQKITPSSCIGFELKDSFASGTNAFIEKDPDPVDDVIVAKEYDGQVAEVALKQGETKKVILVGSGGAGDRKVFVSMDWIDTSLLSSSTFLAAHLIVDYAGIQEVSIQGNDPVHVGDLTIQLKQADPISPTFTFTVPPPVGDGEY